MQCPLLGPAFASDKHKSAFGKYFEAVNSVCEFENGVVFRDLSLVPDTKLAQLLAITDEEYQLVVKRISFDALSYVFEIIALGVLM